MERKYTRIKETTFQELQLDTGIVLTKFDITEETPVEDADIICATTGGVTATCNYTYVDNGEDIDNCPNGMKELKDVDGVECLMSLTALGITAETIKLSLGAADVSGNKITPRTTLKDEDFKDIWWVGDLSNGGAAAVCLKNALSNGGFSLKTSKKAKGKLSIELMGHFSITKQDEVPMEFYVLEPKLGG